MSNYHLQILKVSADPTLLREGQLQRFLRKLENKKFFANKIYDKINSSYSKPASIYNLSKTHKLNIQRNNLSLRPIVYSIDTYNYHPSKFLINLIDPIISVSHCAKDSFILNKKGKHY